MPQITGPQAYAISAPVILDVPDIPDNGLFHFNQNLLGVNN